MPAFDPEYVTSFELGAKTEVLDGSLRLNAALFLTQYDDMQVTGRPANLASGGTGVNNVGLGILNGLEVEALWIVNDNLRIDATLGLLDASVDSLVNDSMASAFTRSMRRGSRTLVAKLFPVPIAPPQSVFRFRKRSCRTHLRRTTRSVLPIGCRSQAESGHASRVDP